jgi:magnesium transporter
MIFAYLAQDKFKPIAISNENQSKLTEALWIDMVLPTKDEETLIEKILSVDIPTREEMLEIEVSSRLFQEDGSIFMTATMLAQVDSSDPQFDAVSFVLDKRQLVTVRYIEPQAFKIFIAKIQKKPQDYTNAAILLIELLDTTIDRLADILELTGRNLDEFSKSIFRPAHTTHLSPRVDYQLMMQKIGANGDINTKAQESLMTFSRLITYLGQKITSQIDSESQQQLMTLGKDIDSLRDHGIFLSAKVNYLLDATLGMVGIEQNQIIKIFSVAAVIFLPPTLIASIYGMNFKIMPELAWHGGYYYALGLMLSSAFIPYLYFKWRKWL